MIFNATYCAFVNWSKDPELEAINTSNCYYVEWVSFSRNNWHVFFSDWLRKCGTWFFWWKFSRKRFSFSIVEEGPIGENWKGGRKHTFWGFLIDVINYVNISQVVSVAITFDSLLSTPFPKISYFIYLTKSSSILVLCHLK